MAELERIPPGEAENIDEIMRLTIAQIKRRYPGDQQALRGVHAKDHGCVLATFAVHGDLAPEYQVGVFAKPGHVYQAWVRFSNADVVPLPDTAIVDGQPAHGSRGMAIKLLNVPGAPLVAPFGAVTLDLLMINQPVFAFPNVEDYLAVSKILQEDGDQLGRFFKERIRLIPGPAGTPVPDMADPVTARTARTAAIIKAIRSAQFQPAPASPVDNAYFSAAPFLFGECRAMKFSARPLCPSTGAPNLADGDNYLRKALHARLRPGMPDVQFSFEVQIRTADELQGKIETDIEDACVKWDAPFHPVATLTIPPQNTDAPERRALCENLFFTPWHGTTDHRPLGGINRLRKAVYDASSQLRHLPKEPASW